jgi:NitT/TauT family transport system substrate-binding protein
MASRRLAAAAAVAALLAAVGCAAPPPPAASQGAPPAAAPGAGAAQPATSAAPPASTAAPLATVKVAGLRSAVDGPIYIGYERGYFVEHGLDLELSAFSDTNEMVPLLAQGQLHVGGSSVAASLFNAIARGIPLKIVADKSHRELGEKVAAGWAVRKDLLDSGQVREAADFRGRSIGLGSRGAQGDMELDVILGRGGLTLDDVDVKDIRYPDQVASFAGKTVDIALTFEPYSITLRDQGLADLLFTSAELIPNNQVSVVMYGPAFWQQQPDLARRWMVAYLRGVRDYTATFHEGKARPKEIIDILVKHTILNRPEAWEKSQPNHINPDGYVYRETLEAEKNWFLSRGLIERDVPLSEAVDDSYVDYAVAALGRYQRQ